MCAAIAQILYGEMGKIPCIPFLSCTTLKEIAGFQRRDVEMNTYRRQEHKDWFVLAAGEQHAQQPRGVGVRPGTAAGALLTAPEQAQGAPAGGCTCCLGALVWYWVWWPVGASWAKY